MTQCGYLGLLTKNGKLKCGYAIAEQKSQSETHTHRDKSLEIDVTMESHPSAYKPCGGTGPFEATPAFVNCL